MLEIVGTCKVVIIVYKNYKSDVEKPIVHNTTVQIVQCSRCSSNIDQFSIHITYIVFANKK